jgi:hypothetical protein
MTKRTFFVFAIATFIAFDLFILTNVVAAHFQSDCGLPAWLGTSGCADDIKRAGFPLIFVEEGGFGYRFIFDPINLVIDIVIALCVSVLAGVVAQRLFTQNDTNS